MRVLLVGLMTTLALPVSAAVPEILLSRQLMEARGLVVGDTVRLATDLDAVDVRSYRIVGSYEPVPDPYRLAARRYEARMHLPDLLGRGEAVERIVVALPPEVTLEEASASISRRMPGATVTPSGQLNQVGVFMVLERFHQAIAAVTVLGSTAFLLALMVMRANERRRITGILRLLGVSERRVVLCVFLEGLLLAVAGAGFGLLLAAGIQGAVNSFFQSHYDTSLRFIRITPALALRSALLAVPLGVLAGVVASWTTLRRGLSGVVRR